MEKCRQNISQHNCMHDDLYHPCTFAWQLLTGRSYKAEIGVILLLLRCSFRWYHFWPKSKFCDFGQKPWTIIRRFYRNRGDFLWSFTPQWKVLFWPKTMDYSPWFDSCGSKKILTETKEKSNGACFSCIPPSSGHLKFSIHCTFEWECVCLCLTELYWIFLSRCKEKLASMEERRRSGEPQLCLVHCKPSISLSICVCVCV